MIDVEPRSSLIRGLMVTPFSIATTIALFAFMLSLILLNDVEIEQAKEFVIQDIVYKLPTPKPARYKEIIKPNEPLPAPDIPELIIDPSELGEITIPNLVGNIGNISPGIFISDRSTPVQQYKVSAHYPRTALRRGIEGYVDVKFDITSTGATENIKILAADPKGIFEKSAIEAVALWKYQPPIVGGKTRGFKGLTNRIKFQIQDL